MCKLVHFSQYFTTPFSKMTIFTDFSRVIPVFLGNLRIFWEINDVLYTNHLPNNDIHLHFRFKRRLLPAFHIHLAARSNLPSTKHVVTSRCKDMPWPLEVSGKFPPISRKNGCSQPQQMPQIWMKNDSSNKLWSEEFSWSEPHSQCLSIHNNLHKSKLSYLLLLISFYFYFYWIGMNEVQNFSSKSKTDILRFVVVLISYKVFIVVLIFYMIVMPSYIFIKLGRNTFFWHWSMDKCPFY